MLRMLHCSTVPASQVGRAVTLSTVGEKSWPTLLGLPQGQLSLIPSREAGPPPSAQVLPQPTPTGSCPSSETRQSPDTSTSPRYWQRSDSGNGRMIAEPRWSRTGSPLAPPLPLSRDQRPARGQGRAGLLQHPCPAPLLTPE
ncbi:hypothetical protein AAFF_G00002150 [Aldrovandia affinis]|uniref:Uncharacterized protein n=1 Tax=Aldrovandia affinis TaxID=143900 RepID=A0AAD7TEL6_9TELE|nr:hypothetical protein AAFF_G00002150 [Aldrovandia affinis]